MGNVKVLPKDMMMMMMLLLLMLFLKKGDLCLCEGLFRNWDLCFSFFQSILFFQKVLSVGPQRSIIYFDTIPS